MPYYAYILKCADGSYYTGSTTSLELRLSEHSNGVDTQAYTYSRRPVELVWTQEFATHDEAFRAEHQIKGWSRAKKEALIRNDWKGIHQIVVDENERRAANKARES
jgi:predicted GIY-YIG superfamily endonuclease